MTGPAPRPDESGPIDADRRRALAWGGMALALLVLAPLGPVLANAVPSCPLKTLTGIPCPLCGATRAALALARLEPVHALTHHPLPAALWIAFIGGGFLAAALALAGRPPRWPRRLPRWLLAALAVAVAASWIYSVLTGV